MTLRTAAGWGIAGSAMPFAQIAAWLVLTAVVGQPMAQMPFHWVALPPLLLAPAAEFGFLVALYRVSAGLTLPPRLNDAALAASVAAMVALAVRLRWTAMPHFFSGPVRDASVWLYRGQWLAASVVEPVAWLVFFLTFVGWPAPPLSRASRRAAAWLAVVIAVAGLSPAWNFVQALLGIFWWHFPPLGSHSYYAWIGVLSGFLEASRWILLVVFALAVWRIPPVAEPPIRA